MSDIIESINNEEMVQEETDNSCISLPWPEIAEPESRGLTLDTRTVAKASAIPGLKLSGLKQPSKIGRPCSGQAKPGLPPVPKNAHELDPKREEYRRQKLTDVEEEVDENDLEYGERSMESPPYRKTRNYSVSSNISMDTLWELHPRRLSEAGLRRHSDTSVVLTEDTDCFIIGMRVWVGGTKPGQIAYLGETQFAPGEWAGIVLDEAIGKNDGSVSGTRYFQCEPKRGVFSRLTRLTLEPLAGAEDIKTLCTPPNANGTRKTTPGASPAGSTRSLMRASPSLNTSTTSLSSSMMMSHDVKLGDRVIVQSSQGSKAGTLRFLGPTDFAKGDWCGVELDDPLGKNDGCVEGKRYFTCQPKFGLFAPLGKVSRSPSSRKPAGQCIVHKSSSSTTSQLRRTGSRDSITSMTSMTSAASSVRRVRLGVTSLNSAKKPIPKFSSTPISRTPLQDVLREKEHHIEQLLKEREIDRSEITRAARHAEQTSNQLLTVEQNYEKYRLESDNKYRIQQTNVEEVEKQNKILNSQLDDEKKKLEDAQFRFEEEALNKDDIEATSKNYLVQINQLEESLTNERLKNEKLEQETKRLFETEEMVSKIQEEMEHLQKEQDNTNVNIDVKKTEIFELKQKLEQSNQALMQEKEKLNDKRNEIDNITKENEKIMKEFEGKMEVLREELNRAHKALKEKHSTNEIGLLKELQKAEIELSSKTFDCETSTEKIKELELKLSHLEEELKSAKCTETESEKEIRWKTNMEQIRNVLKSTVNEFLKIRKSYALQMLEKEMALREKDIKLNYEIIEIQKLKCDFSQSIVDLTQSSAANRDRYNKQIQMRNQQIEDLLNHLQSRSAELLNRQIFATKLEQQITNKNHFISKLKIEMESYTGIHSEQTAYIAKLVEELKIATLKASEFERNYHHAEETILQLKESKQQHEQQFRAILDASKDSNGQLLIINDELRHVENALVNIKLEMTNKLDIAANTNQQLTFDLRTIKEQFKLEKQHIEQQLKIVQDSETCLNDKLELSTNESLKIHAQLKQQIVELNKFAEQNEFDSKRQIEQHIDKIKELEQILDMSIYEAQAASSALSRRIEELADERDQLKQSIKEKTEQLVELEEKVKVDITNQHSVYDKQIIALKSKIDEYKETIEANQSTIKNISQECDSVKIMHVSVERKLSDHVAQINQLTEDKRQSDQALSDLKNTLQQTQEKLNELIQQLYNLNLEKCKFQVEMDQLKEQITELTSQVKLLQTDNSNINNNVLEKDQKLAQILEDYSQIQTRAKSLEFTVQEKDNKMAALAAQLETIIQEKGSTSETFAQQENKIMCLNMQVQQITQQTSTLTTQLTEKNSEITNLTDTCNKMQQELIASSQNKDTEINVLKTHIEKSHQEKQTFTNTLNDAQQNIGTLTNEIQTLQSEKIVHENAIKESEIKLQQFTEELQKMNDINKDNEDKIMKLETVIIKEKENELAELELQIQKLKVDWDEPMNNPVVVELHTKLEKVNKMFKEKEIEVNNLHDRLQAITKEKGHEAEIINALEAQILASKQDIQQLSQERMNLTTEITAKSNELMSLKQHLESEIYQQCAIITDRDNEISAIKTQVEKLMKTATETTISNEQQKTRIQTLEDDKVKLEHTLKENEEEFSLLRADVHKCGEGNIAQIKELEKQVNEKNSTIATLKSDIEKVREENNEAINNPMVKEITTKLEENEKTLKDKDLKLESLITQVATIDQQNQQLQQTWHQSIQQWKAKLSILEMIRKLATQQCDSLEEQVKILTAQKNGNDVEPIIKPVKFEEFKKQIDQDRTELHVALDKTQLLLIDREKELNNHKNECTNLQQQLKQAQKKFAEVSVAVPGATTAAPSGIPKKQALKVIKENVCDMASYQKMQEEKEFALGQVQFLNSIIVDMQQKNAELQSKIQILENEFYEESPNENTNNINRVIPPRQYCDICEEFDLHETEDCPVQMTDAEVVFKDVNTNANGNTNTSRVLPQTRPYCEICEEFGHETENCDADETY